MRLYATSRASYVAAVIVLVRKAVGRGSVLQPDRRVSLQCGYR
jgi:hypothetical protein